VNISLGKAGFLFFIPALLSVSADLLTKVLIFSFFEQQPAGLEIWSGVLYFSRAHNTGVAFGMLQGHNNILGILVGAMAIAIPLYSLWNRKDGPLFLVAMGLVYGGALGNLYDRWAIGYVRDFIDVRFGSYHYPVFNIADSFICIGVALMLIQNVFLGRPNSE
jgi:signal peptidase II